MATRVNRKNTTAVSSKEVVYTEKSTNKNDSLTETITNSITGTRTGAKTASIGKRIAKKNPVKKNATKNTVALKLKAKAKQSVKINPAATKTLLQNKTLESKKKILKNVAKEVKPKKRKPYTKKKNDLPPVLEPIFPLEENIESKKQTKKRLSKKALKNAPDLLDVQKIKVEIDEDFSVTSDITDNNEIPTLIKQVRKPRAPRKQKVEKDSLEEVMNDLSFLIRGDEIKTEVDSMSESGKSDTLIKPKKLPKKHRIELLKNKITKKENLENKLDSADEKIIDILDLNVRKTKKKAPLTRRRHSIEKFPVRIKENEHSLALFSHLPRSRSPKSKRNTKVRQSIDGIGRRLSPYSTRSDSPAKILRNGKQRKLKDLHLLEGLDPEVKRRKLGSDISGSEILFSKLSEYESDSSFSDLASSHGAENIDTREIDVTTKSSIYEQSDVNMPTISSSLVNITPSPDTAINRPTETLEMMDSNSNLCSVPIKSEPDETTVYNSSLMPDKSVLLDIMKQAFNDVGDDKGQSNNNDNTKSSLEVSALLPLTFYGKSIVLKPQENIRELIYNEEENFVPHAENVINIPINEETTRLGNKVEDVIEELAGENKKVGSQEFTEKDSDLESEKQIRIVAYEDLKEFDSDNPVEYETEAPTDFEFSKNDREKFENVTENKVSDNIVTDKINEHLLTQCSIEECDNLTPPALDNQDILSDVVEPDENLLLPEEKLQPIVSVGENLEQNVKEVETEEESESEKKFELVNRGTDNDNLPKSLTEDVNLEAVNMTEVSNPSTAETSEESFNLNADESTEELAEKENVLKALGLQSLRAAEEAKQKDKDRPIFKGDNYTGTLKTVIKINRDKKKGGRSSLKMTLQKNKAKTVEEEQTLGEENYKVLKDGTGLAGKQQGTQSSDTAGAHRKSHYSNRSNLDGSSEHTSDGETATQDGAIKALVIPEKASSFSIHPGRLCKDECSYCFGKFGLFDTPCHIAQMKSVERQDKILATEKHLTRDSCLCDACYRHVDRKSNTPSYMNKSLKRNSLVAPGPRQNHCHVLGCSKVSSNILRRKWIIKMRKSICQVINIDLDNPGLHSIPICDEHYSALEHLMICAMCKRRLARNHIHYLGPETNDLNNALNAEGVPLMLTDKPVVCKLCKCFASIILKNLEERPENSLDFFKEYKRRLLHFNDIVPMDEAAAEEPIAIPSKTEKLEYAKKKKKLVKNPAATGENDFQELSENPREIQERVPSTDTNNSPPQSRSESPSDEYSGVDYNTLIPAIAMDCGSDTEAKKEPHKLPVSIKKLTAKPDLIRGPIEITRVVRTSNDAHRNSDIAVQKLGSNPSISVRQLFPGEEDVPLNGNIDFNNVRDHTPEGWEKCSSIIQYDLETKRLWHELQKPYGNQSSFLRHLVLLEKYFRNGDLVLSPTASHHSINYSESVHNRLKAYDNIPTSAGNIQPMSMLPFNRMQRSSSGIITSANMVAVHSNSTCTNATLLNTSGSTIKSLGNSPAICVTSISNNTPKSTPITLSQLNSPPLIPANVVLQQIRPKIVGTPPGLISLHPGTTRPQAPLVRVPQSQKIKFPITKNWRPNLIPIDPTKKQERKAGLVQVISGGKPYHITLEDYKKMCAIKRSFEMKQKRLQEAQNPKPILVTHNSVLKSIIPRKGLIISKTTTITNPFKNDVTTPALSFPPPPPPLPPINENIGESENILDKLDKQVEKLELKLNEKPSSLLLPKIPKSLTVIPQTVTRKTSRPSSPVSISTPKSNSSKS